MGKINLNVILAGAQLARSGTLTPQTTHPPSDGLIGCAHVPADVETKIQRESGAQPTSFTSGLPKTVWRGEGAEEAYQIIARRGHDAISKADERTKRGGGTTLKHPE